MKIFTYWVISILLLGLVSCAGGNSKDQAKIFPREKTLYMAGFQWGDPTSFNPLNDNPAWPVGQIHNIMYEQLVLYNTLTGNIEPLIGKILEKNDSLVSVLINPEARWSDGKPLTAADVVYSYEISRRFEGAPKSYLWDFISDIKVVSSEGTSDAGLPDADSPRPETLSHEKGEIVIFYVNKEKENNPIVVLDLLAEVPIIPSHVFEAKLKALNNDFSAFQNDKLDENPVVSGPYILEMYSPQKIVLKRRDDYWGNKALYNNRKPAPEFIIHPIFKANDAFSTSMRHGDLDVNSNFIPRIWMKEKYGVRAWYRKKPYFVPASLPMMTINTQRYPLSDRNFRRAMAYAINYSDIIKLAVSNYSPDLRPGLILPFGTEKKYFSQEDVQKYGATFNPAMAKKILADAGYTSVFVDGKLDHMKNAKGERVKPFLIRSPSGWTDWESMVKIAVRDLRAVGVDVREGFCDESMYWECQPKGEFDILMTPTNALSPSLPWTRFQMAMSSRNWVPEGEEMHENQGRYNNPNAPDYNPRVDELLKLIPSLTDPEAIKKAYRELNVIFMQDQPTLPLAYRPEEFYDFSTVHWTNFATEENPYAPPQLPCFGVGRNMLWEIKPKGK